MNGFDFDEARYNMVESQVRPWEVLDPTVLDVMRQTPREDFVPETVRNLAFSDASVPIGHGEVMMPPKLEGRLLQSLDTQPGDKALEIGTGSGFVTACLAKLARHIHSVEYYEDLSQAVAKKLAAHALENVTLEVGDAARGWRRHAPYDVIAVTGSVPELHTDFQNELAIGGRLFVIVGDPPIMEALLITRTGADDWTRESLFETALPPLINAPRDARFVF